MILGMREPWLPAWIEKKRIKRSTLEKIITKANPWLKRIENRMQPRMTYISVHTWERLIGFFFLCFCDVNCFAFALDQFSTRMRNIDHVFGASQ